MGWLRRGTDVLLARVRGACLNRNTTKRKPNTVKPESAPTLNQEKEEEQVKNKTFTRGVTNKSSEKVFDLTHISRKSIRSERISGEKVFDLTPETQ